jgi:high-affinity iron transporter
VTASAPRLTAFALLACALTAGVLWLLSRDTQAPLTRHVAVAPAPQTEAPARGSVLGTTQSAQEVADAAIEGTTGPGGRRPDLSPLPERAFTAPVAHYRVHAVGQAHAMAIAAHRLTAALRAGDAAGARTAWASTYARYLKIGAAYGALGDLDAAIIGRLLGGVDTVASARALERDVAKLPAALRTGEITPLDYATRAHEILEDAQRDQLAGRAGVLATAADLAATREVIGTLRPVLQGRGDVLQQADTRLGELGAVLARIHRAHGSWPELAALSRVEHERLTGALGATLETLAGMPGALETALPPVIPPIK